MVPETPAKRVVFIDPGHGGVDPGTIGVSGTYEKHITLAMARELKAQLDKTGRIQAMLTRKIDIFVPLRERVSRAREAGAELFISIHADAIKNRKTRGLSIYTLSEKASDKEAAALADKENKADLIAGINLVGETKEVTNILIDLARRESMNQSSKFATGLVFEMRRQTKLLRKTHRFAGFAVLKAPDVPSVLIELGFLSNRSDEKALKDKKYRAKLAKGMVRAITGYFSNIEETYKK
jgi:N-acetylmuramoyl-L-alanine amidase